METQTRLSRHNKIYFGGEYYWYILRLVRWLFYMLCIVPEMRMRSSYLEDKIRKIKKIKLKIRK